MLLLEVRVALPTSARLHLVVPIQVLQGGPSDVDTAMPGQEGETRAPTPCSHPLQLDPTLTRPGRPPPCG